MGRIPNKVGRIDRLELDLLADQLSVLEPGVVLEADDGLGAFGLTVPATALIAEHGDAAPEGLVIGPGGLAILVGRAATVMTTESFSRISPSWPSWTSSSKPVRCRAIGAPDWVRVAPAWRGKTRKISPPSARVVTMTRTVEAT